MTLLEIFRSHQGRAIHKWEHYFPVYETYFSRFKDQPLIFYEIGCGFGGSLQMWKHYFGPRARIIGIDIRQECAEFNEDQITVRIGDQSDHLFLRNIIEEFGKPDIVLDDGSHIMAHISESFRYLYPRLAAEGVYMVEDLHTAYWDEYGGGLRRPGTFIEVAKHLVDELNADWARGVVPATIFSRITKSIERRAGWPVL